MKIQVKIAEEYCGRKYALLVPAIIDSDGEITITYLAAWAAARAMQSEIFGDVSLAVRDRSPKKQTPRKHRKRAQ